MKRPQAPGEALLTALGRELGRSLPPDQRSALEGFVRRKFRELSAQLDQWILDDSLERSRRAFPDAALFGDDWTVREAALLPILGNFWAMDALVRRATERGAECREKITKLLNYYGLRERRIPDEMANIAAVTGRSWEGWAPPVYLRAGPVDTKTVKGRATLARRLLVALRRLPVRSVPTLCREVGGTSQQVRKTLNRLAREGHVWSYTIRGYKHYYEALQGDVKLWDLTEAKTDLAPTQYDELVVDTLRRRGGLLPEQLQAIVKGCALDVRASLDRLGERVYVVYRRDISGRDGDFWEVKTSL